MKSTLEKLVTLEIPAVTQEKLVHTIRSMSIHDRLKRAREGKGLTMKALAEQVGVSAWQTIQQWEKEGGTAPKRARLKRVADVLGTTPEFLLFGETAAPQSQTKKKAQDASWPFSIERERFDAMPREERDRADAMVKDTVLRWEATLMPKQRTGNG